MADENPRILTKQDQLASSTQGIIVHGYEDDGSNILGGSANPPTFPLTDSQAAISDGQISSYGGDLGSGSDAPVTLSEHMRHLTGNDHATTLEVNAFQSDSNENMDSAQGTSVDIASPNLPQAFHQLTPTANIFGGLLNYAIAGAQQQPASNVVQETSSRSTDNPQSPAFAIMQALSSPVTKQGYTSPPETPLRPTENDLHEVDVLEKRQQDSSCPKKLTLLLPKRFSQCELISNVEGGQGILFKAWDSVLNKWVAIKKPTLELSSENDAEEDKKGPSEPKKNEKILGKRVLRELKLLRCSNHPNVIKLLGAFTVQRSTKEMKDIYFVMELCDGDLHNLRHQLKNEHKKMDPSLLISIAYQIFSAIAYCHANNIEHRDIKPENIGYKKREDGGFDIVVLDFGFARRVTKPDERRTENAATLTYRSLEVIYRLKEGDYDASRDLWAIGVTIGELITRNRLFLRNDGKSNTRETIVKEMFKLLGAPKLDNSTEKFCKLFVEDDCRKLLHFAKGAVAPSFDETFADNAFHPVNEVLGKVFRELLTQLLKYRKQDRCTAEDALSILRPYLPGKQDAKTLEVMEKEQNKRDPKVTQIYPNELESENLEENFRELLFKELQECAAERQIFQVPSERED